jgi:hypothetical protein
MGAARGVVFAGVSFLPSILVGLFAFMIMGGPNQEWATWMWLPCYIVPGGLIGAAGLYGWKSSPDVEME